MYFIICNSKIIIKKKESILSFLLKVRKWLDGTIMKMFYFAFHNSNLQIILKLSITEKSPVLGQGQHLFTLLKDH